MMGNKVTNDLNIVLIDSHQLFREGVRQVLEKDGQFKVIASSDDYSVLDAVLSVHKVDAILLEVKIFMDFHERVKEIIDHYPVKVIIVGSDHEKTYVKEAIKTGVHGYILEQMDMFSFVDAIRVISIGESYYHSSVTSDLVAEYRKLLHQQAEDERHTAVHRPLHLYTKRECEVLQLLTDGQSNRQIAETLEISEKTVKNHVSSLFKKMKVNDRTQAVVTAIKNNWVGL